MGVGGGGGCAGGGGGGGGGGGSCITYRKAGNWVSLHLPTDAWLMVWQDPYWGMLPLGAATSLLSAERLGARLILEWGRGPHSPGAKTIYLEPQWLD